MSKSEMGESYNATSDPEEQRLILSVLDSFRSYRRLAHLNGTHVRRQAFYSLPREHWMLLSQPPFSLLSTFSKMDDLIDLNASLAEAIFVAGFKVFLAPNLDSEWVASIVPEKYANNEYAIYSLIMDRLGASTSQNDTEKARSCINQFYREWSAEGSIERSACFSPVIAALAQEYAAQSQSLSPARDPSDLRVLVPGVGLGRLVFDICQQGYTVEGNEISYHMLMASALALNETKSANQFTIAPWALNCSNHVNRSHQLTAVRVPDLHPASELGKIGGPSRLPASDRLSMSTGDFCVVYGKEDYKATFDAIATVFFIDTAPNLIRYIEAVRNCLKKGGIWINLGPLLWHPPPPTPRRNRSHEGEDEDAQQDGSESDAGIGDPGSFELSNEEVIALVQHLGFAIEKQEVGTIQTGYISNPQSMLLNTYRPSFWVARKI